MQIQDITGMIENFKIERLCDTILGYNPHDTIIGEWIRWWLIDSAIEERKKRRIINPAICAESGKRRAFADILFVEELEAGSDYFEIIGVAEVENSESKFLEKLDNLSFYEQNEKKKHERKFPDLLFAILCIKVDADYQEGNVVLKNVELINSLKRKMQKHSMKSRMCWVLYLLRYMKHEDEYHLSVKNYVPGFLGFRYNYAFRGNEFFIYHKAKQIKHNSFLMGQRFSKKSVRE